MSKEGGVNVPMQSPLVAMNAGYDQVSDPPSYRQATVGGAPPQGIPQGTYPAQPVAAGPPVAYPAYASPQHVVVQQPAATTVTIINPPVAVIPYTSTLAVVNLVWAIFGFICCCSPISIAAIVFSAISLSLGGDGNAMSANRYAKVSLWLNIINMVIIIGVIIFIVVWVTAEVKEVEDSMDDYNY